MSSNGQTSRPTNGHADHGDRPASKSAAKARSPYKHATAIHTVQSTSILTSGAAPTPNFNGFRNLMLLVILVSNLRLMIENFGKYGVLICIRCHDYSSQDLWYGTILYLSVPCSLLIAYLIELGAAQWAKVRIGEAKKSELPLKGDYSTSWHLVGVIHGLNATVNLAVASYVVYYMIHHPGIGTICELHAIIVWLKTCSYALTNRDLRHALLSSNATPQDLPDYFKTCLYPSNITLGNLTYFWWAPTLVYQPVYPRTDKIRWMFVLKRGLELVGLSIAIWLASAQYAVPLLHNSISAINNLNAPSFLERLMKLSSISLFCWLAGFFALFQSGLNMLAEILRFGDRRFYDDWWNTPDVKSYWAMWNRPVYHFMKRHVFAPLVGRGCPPMLASVIVFILSGVLHEMAVGVPTHNVIGTLLCTIASECLLTWLQALRSWA